MGLYLFFKKLFFIYNWQILFLKFKPIDSFRFIKSEYQAFIKYKTGKTIGIYFKTVLCA